MPLLYTPDLLFEGFSLSRAVLLDSEGNEQPDGEIYGVRSAVWEPEIESYDEFSHEKLINVWSDVRRVNFTMEAGYTSLVTWSKMTGSSVESEALITNLLTSNEASPMSTSGWAAGSLTKYAPGEGYIDFTTTSSSAWQAIQSTSAMPVVAGETYTLTMQVDNLAGERLFRVNLWWKNSSGATFQEDGEIAAGLYSNTWVAPEGAVAVVVGGYFTYGTMATGDRVRLSRIGFWEGAGGSWVLPGEPVVGVVGNPSNYVDRLSLYEHGKSNGMSFPVRITFPAKDAAGNMQDLSLTLFKVKFKPPKSSGAAYKDGQSVTYEATAVLSATDETGAVLEREAFGRIDRAYSVG